MHFSTHNLRSMEIRDFCLYLNSFNMFGCEVLSAWLQWGRLHAKSITSHLLCKAGEGTSNYRDIKGIFFQWMNASSATVQGTTGHAIKGPFSGMRAKNEKLQNAQARQSCRTLYHGRWLLSIMSRLHFQAKLKITSDHFAFYLIMYYVKLKPYKGTN